MYGMVNEGVHALVASIYGEQAWEEICTRAGLQRAKFELMSTYEDEVTYDLVDAICAKTGLAPEEVLETFGKYWIKYAGASAYGSLMRLSGRTFIERIMGLDDMHERILLSMPHLKPPSFDLEEVESGIFHLHYFSVREGLAPMVIGLLHGLASETGETVEVRIIERKGASSDHDVFEIRLNA